MTDYLFPAFVTMTDLEFIHAGTAERIDAYHSNQAAVVIGGGSSRQLHTDIRLQRIAVRNCGGAGISVENVQRLEILDCAVMCVGASGIQMRFHSRNRLLPLIRTRRHAV